MQYLHGWHHHIQHINTVNANVRVLWPLRQFIPHHSCLCQQNNNKNLLKFYQNWLELLSLKKVKNLILLLSTTVAFVYNI